MRTILPLITLLAILSGLLPTTPAQAQGGPPPPRFAQIECGFGAYLANSACVYGELFAADGRTIAGQQVTLEWVTPDGHTRLARTRTVQRPSDSVGQAGFLFIIPSSEWSQVAPWTLIMLHSTIQGYRVERRLLLRPNPLSLSIRADLRADMRPGPTRPPVAGRTFTPGTPSQAAPATVTISYPRLPQPLIVTTSASPRPDEQSFRFMRPDLPWIQTGTPITLLATSLLTPTLQQSLLMRWPGEPIEVDFYLGWGCDYTIPKSGGKSLPERFCLSGQVLLNGEPLAEGQTATVIVRVGNRSVTTTAGPSEVLLDQNYALDISELLLDQPNATTVEIAASLDGSPASDLLVTTAGDLRRAGTALRANLNLLPEWSVAAELPIGGRVLARASTSGYEAAIVEGSGVWLRRSGEAWGYPGPLQPCREGTALAFATASGGTQPPPIDCRDQAGATHRSLDGGASWAPAPIGLADPPAPPEGDRSGATTALLPLEGSLFIGASDGVFRQSGGPPVLLGGADEPLPNNVRDLVTCTDTSNATYLIALSPQSVLRRPLDAPADAPWEALMIGVGGSLNGQALTRLGNRLIVGRSASSDQILVGQGCGDPLLPAALDVAAARSPITALAAADGKVIAAARSAGVLISDDGASWVAFSAGLPAGQPISALAALEDDEGCSFFAVQGGASPRLYERDCGDEGGVWHESDQPIPAGLVGQLAATRQPGAGPAADRVILYAASDGSLLRRVGAGAWVVRGANAGPLQLLDLALPANFNTQRRMLVAGLGPQVLSYGDIAPDLNLSLSLDQISQRQGQPIVASVTVQNLGGQTARAVRLTLDPGRLQAQGLLEINLPDLLPGESLSRTLDLLLPLDPSIVPGQATTITATVSGGDDSYVDNNTQAAELFILPRRGSDLSLTLASQGALKPGVNQELQLALVYTSQGEERATNPRIHLNSIPEAPGAMVWQGRWKLLPVDIPIGNLAGSEQSGGTRCDPICNQLVKLRFPGKLNNAQQLTLTGEITLREVDRAPADNTDSLTITVGSGAIDTLFVVNYQRLGIGQHMVRDEIGRIAQLARLGIRELRVDTLTANRWRLIDQALSRGDTRAAIDQTMAMVSTVRTEIMREQAANPNLRYVVLVGGDNVIPYGVVPSRVRSQSDNLAESYILERSGSGPRIPSRTPVYATLAENYYPSDDAYVIDTHSAIAALPDLMVARLVETPDDIARQLRTFREQLGVRLDVNQAETIGYAPEITEDHWLELCARFGADHCYSSLRDRLGRSASAAISYLQIGGHGSPWQVGDISAVDLVPNVVRSATPLILMVSCHTGLSFAQPRSLPAALFAARNMLSGGSYIAALGFAYGSVGTSDYSEELALIFDDVVSRGAPGRALSVGEALREAKRRYLAATDTMSELDWKVLREMALYGMPMQQLGAPTLPTQPTSQPTLADANQTLTHLGDLALQQRQLTLDYTFVSGEPETSGRADYGPGSSQGSYGEYGVRQPYYQTILTPITDPVSGELLVPTAAFLSESAYNTLSGFDPLITQATALSSDQRFHEPADRIVGWEQTRLVTAGALPDNRLLVRVWLGQYRGGPHGSIERLLHNPKLTVVYASAQPKASSSAPGTRICRASEMHVAVSVPARNLAQAFVTYTLGDGRWRSLPLLTTGSELSALLPADPNLEFFVQAIDNAGRLTTGVKSSSTYYGMSDAACTTTLPRGPIALYTFDEGGGTQIFDRASAGDPLNLEVADPNAVRWLDGALAIDSSTIIRSTLAASKISAAVRRSGEISIEWFGRPANTGQDGPARIVTISATPYERNVTLGQGRWDNQPSAVFDGRIRTTTTGPNGEIALTSPDGSLTTALTHVVLTRSANGGTRIYVNGVELAHSQVPGALSGWDDTFRLALANELTMDRPWLGEFNQVAIFDRVLSLAEIRNRAKDLGVSP